MKTQNSLTSSLALLSTFAFLGCSASGGGGPSLERDSEQGEQDKTPAVDEETGGFITMTDGDEPEGPGACASTSADATLVKESIDIILALDNSGSMSDELQAVEDNININFANILDASDVDYRVILISRHRREPRGDSGESSTSICVTSPLSGLLDCSMAPDPVFSDRFFHYSTKIESTDSFNVIVDTYQPPFNGSDCEARADVGADCGDHEERSDQAPLGWSAWVRPDAKKVFLELTDADEDMPAATFVQLLTSMAPEHFGSDPANPTFVFHSITGIGEKDPPTAAYQPDEPIVATLCQGDVDSPGTTYQELSRLTGGLRFPICQFGSYDVVFQAIAEDVVFRSEVACDFALPEPPNGGELRLDNVAVTQTGADGTVSEAFGQARTVNDCIPNAFYIENDRVFLCPDTCTGLRLDQGATVDVLFTCESNIIMAR